MLVDLHNFVDTANFTRDLPVIAKRKTRAIAVQLTPQTVKRLDELAAESGMSRHRYMILILERAVKANVTVREEIAFSNLHP